MTPDADLCTARPQVAGRLRRLAALLALQTVAGAQYLPAVADVDYTGPSVTSHAGQRLNLFLPDCDPPPDGFPVVVTVVNSGFASTALLDEIGPETLPIHQMLDAGFAVAWVSTTYSSASSALLGNGLFHPPGASPPGWVGPPPYADPARPMAEKDVVMAVQHLRHHAGALGLDASRMVLHGRSGGAVVAMWCALGPERGAMTFPNGTGQELESTRVAAAVLQSGLMWIPGYVQTTPIAPAKHLPRADGGPAYDAPATVLAQTFSAWQQGASPLVYEDASLNATMPVYLTYADATASTDYAPATPGQTDYVEDVLVDDHSSWHGFAWKTRYPQPTRLVLLTTAPLPFSGGLHDALIPDHGEAMSDAIAWLHATLATGTPWTDLGQGLAGTGSSTPVLQGCGSLADGAVGQLGLTTPLTDAPVFLVVGLAAAPTPLFGGVLVPTPNWVIPAATDPLGALQVPIDLTGLPSGFGLWVQAWIPDAAGPQGYAASNALGLVKP